MLAFVLTNGMYILFAMIFFIVWAFGYSMSVGLLQTQVNKNRPQVEGFNSMPNPPVNQQQPASERFEVPTSESQIEVDFDYDSSFDSYEALPKDTYSEQEVPSTSTSKESNDAVIKDNEEDDLPDGYSHEKTETYDSTNASLNESETGESDFGIQQGDDDVTDFNSSQNEDEEAIEPIGYEKPVFTIREFTRNEISMNDLHLAFNVVKDSDQYIALRQKVIDLDESISVRFLNASHEEIVNALTNEERSIYQFFPLIQLEIEPQEV
jgi:hypothetical protein